MKINRTIRIKAVFLLVVFALNTMVGFACAVGMEFNSKHHSHHEEGTSETVHHHGSVKHHHHDEAAGRSDSKEEDNCCNKNVIQFSQLDKLLAHAINTGIEAPVTLIFLHAFYSSYLSPFAETAKQFRVVRPCFPNSPDIRVSIRSFQI